MPPPDSEQNPTVTKGNPSSRHAPTTWSPSKTAAHSSGLDTTKTRDTVSEDDFTDQTGMDHKTTAEDDDKTTANDNETNPEEEQVKGEDIKVEWMDAEEFDRRRAQLPKLPKVAFFAGMDAYYVISDPSHVVESLNLEGRRIYDKEYEELKARSRRI